jgi:hypothetical protein
LAGFFIAAAKKIVHQKMCIKKRIQATSTENLYPYQTGAPESVTRQRVGG